VTRGKRPITQIIRDARHTWKPLPTTSRSMRFTRKDFPVRYRPTMAAMAMGDSSWMGIWDSGFMVEGSLGLHTCIRASMHPCTGGLMREEGNRGGRVSGDWEVWGVVASGVRGLLEGMGRQGGEEAKAEVDSDGGGMEEEEECRRGKELIEVGCGRFLVHRCHAVCCCMCFWCFPSPHRFEKLHGLIADVEFGVCTLAFHPDEDDALATERVSAGERQRRRGWAFECRLVECVAGAVEKGWLKCQGRKWGRGEGYVRRRCGWALQGHPLDHL
jgi:hypothetical protein